MLAQTRGISSCSPTDRDVRASGEIWGKASGRRLMLFAVSERRLARILRFSPDGAGVPWWCCWGAVEEGREGAALPGSREAMGG
jgi:hypothetical protein